MAEMIEIYNPFQRQIKKITQIPPGASLVNYCENFLTTINKMYETSLTIDTAGEHIAISINGIIIEHQKWHVIFPNSGDQIVVMPIVGKGDFWNTILQIALLVAIIYFAPIIAGSALLGGMAVGTLGYTIAYVATIAIGGILISSLARPNIKKSSSGGLQNPTEQSQTFGWNPATTQQQGITVPRFYGRNKLYGNVVAAWTKITGAETNIQDLYTLFAYGIGPYKGIVATPDEQIKLNNQAIQNLTGITKSFRNGLVRQSIMTNFEQVKIEFTPNRKVTNDDGAIVYETLFNLSDNIEIDLAFPRGLYDGSGASIVNYSVNVKVEIKKTSEQEGSFLELTQPTETYTDDSVTKVIRTITSQRRTITGITKVTSAVITCVGHQYKVDDIINFTDVIGMVEINGEFGTVTIVHDNNTFRVNINSTGFTPYDSGGIAHKDLSQIVESRNLYDIRVTKVTADKNLATYGDILYLDRIRLIVDEEFSYPRTALQGIKALATDQLSGSIGFSAIVDCLYVRVYDDDTETWSIKYSTNPAWILFDILTLPIYNNITPDDITTLVVSRYQGKNPNELDLPKFVELANFCDQEVPNTIQFTVISVSIAVEAVIKTASVNKFLVGNIVEFNNIAGIIDGTQATILTIIDIFNFSTDMNTIGSSIPSRADKLHVQFNGDDGSSDLIDISTLSNIMIMLPGGSITTSHKKFGTASLDVPDDDGCETAEHPSNINVCGSLIDNWTIDLWYKSTDIISSIAYLVTQNESTTDAWRFYVSHTNDRLIFSMTSGSISKVSCISRSNALTAIIGDGDFHHLAMCKVADNIGIYLDGAQIGYDQLSGTDIFDKEIEIGQLNSSNEIYGYIDELRINNSNIFNAAPNNNVDGNGDDSFVVPTLAYNSSASVALIKHFIEFNGGFDEATSVWEAASQICELARCALTPIGSKLSLAIDKEQDIIVQTFTVGNINKDSFSIEYLPDSERASEIELHYRDEQNDFVRTPFSIFNVDILNENKVTVDLFGITDERMAEDSGTFRLLKNKLLKKVISFNTDVNAIHCTIGDRIRVQHDLPDWGGMSSGDEPYGGGGQVVSATNITNATVTINRLIKFNPGLGSSTVYELLIAHAVDDSTEIKTITAHNEETNTITVDGIFTIPPAKGDVWAIGKQNLITQDYTVILLSVSDDQKIEVQAIDYNAAIYVNDP